LNTLKKRAEFLKVKNIGLTVKGRYLIVQAARLGKREFGFTASNRVGCAVLRNKAKRRLRHLVRLYEYVIPINFSVVIIANAKTASVDFRFLLADFDFVMKKFLKLLD
jgi:ribonuclease P protein component